MIWVKDQHELPDWEITLIEIEVEMCYAERAYKKLQSGFCSCGTWI